MRTLAAGRVAGYGRRLVADASDARRDVPVGYADGYPRRALGRADVLVRRPTPARSLRQSRWMQLSIVVDDDVAVGDEVVLLGDGRRADPRRGARRLAGTIGYEIGCATALAARRGRRTYIGQ